MGQVDDTTAEETATSDMVAWAAGQDYANAIARGMGPPKDERHSIPSLLRHSDSIKQEGDTSGTN